MSVAELKQQVASLTADERLELAAWITHLNQKDDPDHKAELARRMAAMDAGTKITRTELERLMAGLNAQGR
jgi:alanine racemase